jgi:acyl-CoA synthetase (NDP forming)
MSVEITPERLRSLFRPRNVALVGASEKSNFSRGTYANLRAFGFADRTFLVNARGAETHGQATYTSCAAVVGATGQAVDLAHMMVPQAATLDALAEAAASGVRNAVVLSSGYAETGADGRAEQERLVERAHELDVALLGPNMLGFVNFVDQLAVMPGPVPVAPAGSVALLSQSGASAAAMSDFATQAGVGLSYLVTLGNEAMITAGHVIDFLVEDESTKAIAVFLEAIRDPERFRAAARRAAAAGKAIVVLKVGASELSARAAAAHTGALVGDDKVVDAVLADLGVIRVDTIEDMMITAGAAAHLGRLQAPGIGIVSFSGGVCDILADRAEARGVVLPELAPETAAAIAEEFAAFGTVQNPLDVTGAATIRTELFTHAIERMSADPAIGAIAVVGPLPGPNDASPWRGLGIAQAIGAGIDRAQCPVVLVNQVMTPRTPIMSEVLAQIGEPYLIPGLDQTMVALGGLSRWSARLAALDEDASEPRRVEVPAVEDRVGSWSEAQARELLAAAGIPVVPAHLVTSADGAAAAAAELGGSVALKVVSPQILHKSDIGGVRLGVRGDDAVRAAYDAVVTAAEQVPDAKVDGVLVSPMREPAPELLVGVVRDEHWGPILAVAVGGVLVEVLDDSVLSPLPVSPAHARTMLGRLRAAAVLQGVRGGRAADLDVLAEVISRIGDLALALGDDLVALEVNPLRADGDLVEALDAVVEWQAQA